jgi:hypothetical protein
MTIAGQSFTVTQAGTSASTDTAPPTATLTAPTSGATVTGTISAAASATDNVGVTRVDFYRDGSTLVGTDSAAPYTVLDDTTKVANGTHTYCAKAYDAAGNSTVSAYSTVTVQNSVPPSSSWARSLGGPSTDSGRAVAVDSSGNIFVTGYFAGTASFGGTSLTSKGTYDMFLVKYSAAGVVQWAKSFGNAGSLEFPTLMAIDANNNIVVAGSFNGTCNVGTGGLTSAGGYDLFLAGYQADGTPRWSKRFGGVSDENPNGLAVNKTTGEIVLIGTFTGTADFSGGLGSPLSSYYGGQDSFLAKYGADGTWKWSKNYLNISTDLFTSVGVDGGGNIMLAGTTDAFINFGGQDVSVSGSAIATFLVKLNGTGTQIWAKSWNTPATPKVLVVDGSGNSFMTGTFGTSVNIGGSTLVSHGDLDIFLGKYDANGNHVWSESFGGPLRDVSSGLALDPAGNVVMLG